MSILTKDPIGFAGGDVNLYRYVQNNPLNSVDPSGLLGPVFWVRPWPYIRIPWRTIPKENYQDWADWAEYNLPPNVPYPKVPPVPPWWRKIPFPWFKDPHLEIEHHPGEPWC